MKKLRGFDYFGASVMQVLDNLETALQEGVANVFGLGMKIWLFEKDRWRFEWLVGFFASICVVLVGPRVQ